MEEKYTVKMLAALKNESISDLAKNAGINFYHLRQVANGRIKMTIDDLFKLADYTGIDVRKIAY